MKYARTPLIIITLIVLFHASANFIWLSNDNNPVGYDTAHHLLNTYKFYLNFNHILSSHKPFFETIAQETVLIRQFPSFWWPSLLYFLGTIITGHSFSIFVLRYGVNLIFLAILLFSTYFSAQKLFNTRIALISCVIIGLIPPVFGLSRQYGLDVPFAACLSLAFCFLLYSNGFSNPLQSILFGMSLGISMLFKLYALIYIGPMIVLLFIRSLRKSPRYSALTIASWFLTSIALSALIASVYWGGKTDLIVHAFKQHFFLYYPWYNGNLISTDTGTIPVMSFQSIFFYVKEFIHSMSLPTGILFFFSLSRLLKEKKPLRPFIVFAVIVPIGLLTLFSAKSSRFLLPLHMYTAIIIAWNIESIVNRRIRITTRTLVLCFLLFQYVVSSWVESDIRFLTYLDMPTRYTTEYATTPIRQNFFNKADHSSLELIKDNIAAKIKKGHRPVIAFSGRSAEYPTLHLMLFLNDSLEPEFIAFPPIICTREQLSEEADYLILPNKEEEEPLNDSSSSSKLNNFYVIKQL